MRKFLLSIMIVLTSLLGYTQTTLESTTLKQVIVVPVKGQEIKTISFIQSKGAKVIQSYEQLGWYLVEIPNDQTQDAFINVCKSSRVISKTYKDEVMEYKRDYIPNDANFTTQWHLKQISDKDIDADQAWDSIPQNNQPTKVAVFDGGIDITHEDLIGNIVTPFNAVTNQYSNGELVNSEDKHGTACSGTIAAVTNNAIGVASVGGNKVKVMPINIMSAVYAGGSFNTSSSIQINAINAAMAQGCVAISMSYGGSSFAQALSDAFILAKTQGRSNKGIFICASSGNGYSGTIVQYPASYSAVYGIGATTSSDTRAAFSNYGTICDISAPGASIFTTDRTGVDGYASGNYASVSGTSFSCPIVAAAGALLIYKNVNLTEISVMSLLASTCEKVGGYVYYNDSNWPYSTRSNELGYGRINLYQALLATPLVGNPIITPPNPQHNIYVSNCSVSNPTPSLGSTITINTTQFTSTPSLSSVSPKVQYRLSNDNLWSSDDIVIGTDTSTVGGGISSNNESISYTVPTSSQTGTKYILIRGNFDGSVSESTSIDNSCSVQITIFNPAAGGKDLQIFWLSPSLTTCNTSTGSTTTIRFKNTGSVPISAFTWKIRWENCPMPGTPSYYYCNNLMSGQGYLTSPLLPGQMSGTYTFNLCLANCGLSSNPYTVLPIGTTMNMVAEIVTVDGVTGDDFLGNNISLLPITRISCTSVLDSDSVDSENVVKVENPNIKIYTITGVPIDITDKKYLTRGLYIIHYIYTDHTDVEKISIP